MFSQSGIENNLAFFHHQILLGMLTKSVSRSLTI